jgi:hypothetical protein
MEACRLKTNSPAAGIATHLVHAPLWDLGIKELTGHNIESAGREEVNKMLNEGWLLLHIYTLKYQEDGEWRERPMAILGKPKSKSK